MNINEILLFILIGFSWLFIIYFIFNHFEQRNLNLFLEEISKIDHKIINDVRLRNYSKAKNNLSFSIQWLNADVIVTDDYIFLLQFQYILFKKIKITQPIIQLNRNSNNKKFKGVRLRFKIDSLKIEPSVIFISSHNFQNNYFLSRIDTFKISKNQIENEFII